ncbi:MAG: hypothetical protein HEQ37_08535 [Acidovorax sp.]|nr:hypothetical protein [Acidovorax sp.]
MDLDMGAYQVPASPDICPPHAERVKEGLRAPALPPAPGLHDNACIDQRTLGLDLLPKKTRREVFLDEMNQVVPWATLVTPITQLARGAHQALGGRPLGPIETMLLIHFVSG